MNTHKWIVLAFLFALAVVQVCAYPVAGADGEKWLKWADETRSAYVESYIDGLTWICPGM